jgi:hypothetical protein
MQNTGERINHVRLPPWAKEDPLLFVVTNRLVGLFSYSRFFYTETKTVLGFGKQLCQREPASLD